ncbi:MAG: peptidase T [Sphingobacteriia bacterium]|nr:MAG: peptidase T [Sphingobacteriia bacterium]
MLSLIDRFMRYVQLDTQSDPHSHTHPSTAKQKILGALLAQELTQMGAAEVWADEYGYVYASIPATVQTAVPVLAFCSHLDTAPDCSGTHVQPILHHPYDGADLVLPDDPQQVIRMVDHPALKRHMGQPVITASGQTLLGADDKAGVAIIMEFAQHLLTHPTIPHGLIKLVFTPDEEIGQGTDKLDFARLGANFAYTLDGGSWGSFEDETFSADGMTIEIQGIMAHPGAAKGIMVNALKIGARILQSLPPAGWSPETTADREGFVHPHRIEGNAETVRLEFLLRSFHTPDLAVYAQRLRELTESVLLQYPGASARYMVHEQYRNMKEVLDQFPFIRTNAQKAYARAGVPFVQEPIRGGTDGSRLSFLGLPCANIFTGMQAIHGKQEWVGVADMSSAVDVLLELVQVWADK